MQKKGIRFTYLLKPHWMMLTIAFIAVLGETATDLLAPWPLKVVFDYVLATKSMPRWMSDMFSSTVGLSKMAILHVAVLSLIIIAVVGAISTYVEKYFTTSVGQWVMHDLRRALYHHIQRLSLSYHDQKRTGELIATVTGDIDAIQDFVSQALLGIVVDVLTLLGMLLVMFYLDWRFTLIALSVTPLLFVVVYSYTHRIKKASRALRKKEGEVVSIVQEVFSSIRLVKAFAREEYEERRFEKQSLDNVETALLSRSIKMKLAPLVDIIVAIGTCLMLGYGAQLVLTHRLSAGDLVVFLSYLGKMYKPMRDLSKMSDTVSKAGVGLERIREIIGTESAVRDLPRAHRAKAFKGTIEFDKVSFGYSPEQSILKDVSFKIEPGQVAAFVGPTGSGKTSIINLVARFYDPGSGTIKIDGADIRSYTIKSIRDQISFVLQDTVLFHTPIWENIAYGRPEATRDEIIRAAKLANADEFIVKMPEGYDTMVGERGVTLSGGQRQRIAIARAVIRNTPILILDEPTSGLDAQSEQAVFEALERLMKNKTSIVIAHHLATILRADTIFVVKDCELKERGTHEELLAAGGFYAELYQIQNAAPEVVV